MNVGIITFHAARNYGAALQCYALQRAVESLGQDAVVINYLPEEMTGPPWWRGWGVRLPGRWGRIKQRYRVLRHAKRTEEVFSAFRQKHLHLTPSCSSDIEMERAVDGLDAVIAGSDQVWVFDRSPHYFLKLTNAYAGRRVSYAACCGHDRQNPSRRDLVRGWISGVDYISVRNEFSRRIVADLVDQPVWVTADPTLLVDMPEMNRKPHIPFDSYILVYSLSGDRGGRVSAIVDTVRRRSGHLPVVDVMGGGNPHPCPYADHTITDASPEEWVGLIARAEFVCTDSYHGVLFALAYQRPFICWYTEEWRALRLKDAALRYGFESALGHDAEDAVSKIERNETDYDRVAELISGHVSQSWAYLRMALAGDGEPAE